MSEPTVATDPPAAPPVDPSEPLPVQSDNGPRPEDGDQSAISQDPNEDLTAGESL